MMLEHGFDGLAQVGPAYRNLTESKSGFCQVSVVRSIPRSLSKVGSFR